MISVNPIGGVDAALATKDTGGVTNAASRITQGQKTDNAKEAAEQFESVFLSQLFNMMFSGVKTDGMFGGGTGEQMWRTFLVDHIADAYAERGGIGISNAVMAQIIQMSESAE